MTSPRFIEFVCKHDEVLKCFVTSLFRRSSLGNLNKVTKLLPCTLWHPGKMHE
ncbi:hypothetical protein XENOCAPTIV_000542, partial [Xenoophorus captivus]